MRKSRAIILMLLIFIIATILPVSASGTRCPEPEKRPDIGNSAVWDEELGMYISDILVKNDSGEYKLNQGAFTVDTQYGTSSDGETLNANDVWYAEHKDSSNAIDRAILESISLLRSQSLNESNGWSSIPKDAHDMPEIVSCMGKLDQSCLKELWEKTCTEKGWRAQKIVGLEHLLSIRIDNNLCGGMMYDIWYGQFSELKTGVLCAPTEELNVKNYGYLAIPVLIDRWKSEGSAGAEAALLTALNEVCPGTVDADSWITKNSDFLAALRYVLDKDFEWVKE